MLSDRRAGQSAAALLAAAIALPWTSQAKAANDSPAPITEVDLEMEPPPTSDREVPLFFQPPYVNDGEFVLGEMNMSIFGGPTFTSGLDTGGYERFGMEAQFAPLWRTTSVGPTFGLGMSLEQWETAGAWGIGVPLEASAGVRLLFNYLDTDTVWMTVRIHTALSLLEVDKVDGVVGGGVFAPTIGADFTVGSPWFRMGAEVRATYRWEWQIEDRAQISMGIATVFPLVLDHIHLD